MRFFYQIGYITEEGFEPVGGPNTFETMKEALDWVKSTASSYAQWICVDENGEEVKTILSDPYIAEDLYPDPDEE